MITHFCDYLTIHKHPLASCDGSGHTGSPSMPNKGVCFARLADTTSSGAMRHHHLQYVISSDTKLIIGAAMLNAD